MVVVTISWCCGRGRCRWFSRFRMTRGGSLCCAGSNQYRRSLPPLFSGTAGVLPYKLALAWAMGLDWLLARSRIVGRAGDDDVASEQRNKDRPAWCTQEPQ